MSLGISVFNNMLDYNVEVIQLHICLKSIERIIQNAMAEKNVQFMDLWEATSKVKCQYLKEKDTQTLASVQVGEHVLIQFKGQQHTESASGWLLEYLFN